MLSVSRHTENPILAPVRQRPWESVATFNPSAAKAGGETLLFYRAMARPDALITPYAGRSTIGLATSRGGGDFEDRRQVIVPSEPWDRYGCEDPRATLFEGRWYVFYTALAGYPYAAEKVKIAVAIGEAPDRLSEKHLVTAFNAKAAALFPERIDGKLAMILSVHTDSPPRRSRSWCPRRPTSATARFPTSSSRRGSSWTATSRPSTTVPPTPSAPRLSSASRTCFQQWARRRGRRSRGECRVRHPCSRPCRSTPGSRRRCSIRRRSTPGTPCTSSTARLAPTAPPF